ncbi:MAG: hypothetical protein R3208_14940 [Ketobacteraceae bacterium]|nr:hypothetical protein [Ketobacteraceae bacterium]
MTSSIHFNHSLQITTRQEVENLPGYQVDNPVSSVDYLGYVAPFHLADEIECCYKKPNGALCRQRHKKGSVILLKNGSLGVIGQCCRKNYFPEENSIHADHRKVWNDIQRQRRLKALADLITGREENQQLIQALNGKLTMLQERVEAVLRCLPERIVQLIQDRIKSERLSVDINAVTYKRWIDENGREQQEKRTTPYTVGSLAPYNILVSSDFRALRRALNDVELAYDEGAELLREDPHKDQIHKITQRIRELSKIDKAIDKLTSSVSGFCQQNHLCLLYLTDQKSDAVKLARAVMELQGQPGGREVAKSWLCEQREQLAKAISCDKIEIP